MSMICRFPSIGGLVFAGWLCLLPGASGAGAANDYIFHGLTVAGGGGDDEAGAIAVDAAGGLRVAGKFAGTATFGESALNAVGSGAGFVARLDSGRRWVWAQEITGAVQAVATGVACDAEGNTFAGGFYLGAGNVGDTALTNLGGADAFVAKFDVAGSLVWARRFGAARDDRVKAVAAGPGGGVYIAGHFEGTVAFGAHSLVSAGGADVFVARVNGDGEVVWAVRGGGGSADEVYGLAANADGLLAVAGTVAGDVQFGDITLTNALDTQAFVAACDAAGAFRWAWSGGSTNKDRASGVALDAAGRVTVTGYLKGPVSWAGTEVTNAGLYTFTARFDEEGVLRWVTPGGGQDATAVWVGTNGEATVAGSFVGTNQFGATALTSQGDFDVFLQRLDSLGNVIWARSAGGTNFDAGLAIAPAGEAGLWVAGRCGSGAAFDTLVATNARANDVFVAELSPVPMVLQQPVGVVVHRGDPATLAVGVVGAEPLACQWFLDRVHAVPGATNLQWVLPAVTRGDAGSYTAVITNAYGAVTSAPAALTVYGVGAPEVRVNGARGAHFAFTNVESVEVTLSNAEPGLTLYYALDGSQPSFKSVPYAGPFAVRRSGTIRAIAFDSDLASAESEPVELLMTLAPPEVLVEGIAGDTFTFTNRVGVSVVIQCGLPGAQIHYTTNDTAPTLESAAYEGPFTVSSNLVLRAMAFSPELGQATSGPVAISFRRTCALVLEANPDGTVALDPPGGVYGEGTSVRLSAVPMPGWGFIRWEGDATGTDDVTTVVMDRDRAVRAVFGTELALVQDGAGRVDVRPRGPLFPRGQTVRLAAIAEPGRFFARWSGALDSVTNPATFTVSSPSPVVVASFSPLPDGVVTLTVVPNGAGSFQVVPASNFYTNGQVVELTALPDPGVAFLKWTGDVSTRTNPVSVVMDANKWVTANFSGVGFSSLEDPVAIVGEGMVFHLLSDPGMAWSLERSMQGCVEPVWAAVGAYTNESGFDAVTNLFEPGSEPVVFRLAQPVP